MSLRTLSPRSNGNEIHEAARSASATTTATRQILLITHQNQLHESLHLGIYNLFWFGLIRSGSERDWRHIGAPTYRILQGQFKGDVGEADSSGGPRPERKSGDAWPALVVEAGISQSLEGLRRKAEWWFAASNHQVHIVLLAKFEHRRRSIILEKWEEVGYAATLRLVLQQTTTIAQVTVSNQTTYEVTGDTLMLGFEPLFLRGPGPGDADFVYSVGKLRVYAEDCWLMYCP